MKQQPMPTIELMSRSKDTVVREIYNVIHDGEPYILIDFLNDKGEAIDTIVRDEYGNNIDNPEVFQEIIAFVDKLNESNLK